MKPGEWRPVYLVQKFFPPRCPHCEHRFRRSSDFMLWGGLRGKSLIDAMARQRKVFNEMYNISESTKGIFEVQDRFGTDFIVCTHCRNVTLRIMYATRQVMTRSEAEHLVQSEGFTCWQRRKASGRMAQPYVALDLLGSADLKRLEMSVQDARRRASSKGTSDARGDAFSKWIDPALIEIMNKVREKRLASSAEKSLKRRLDPYWGNLSEDCRDFLLTGELLKDQLTSIVEGSPGVDFSPAVASYSKALETEVLQKLFKPFSQSSYSKVIPDLTGKSGWDRSIEVLRSFVAKRREPTLGEMGFCLKHLGCEMSTVSGNGLAHFMEARLGNLNYCCERYRFPQRVIEYVQKYRNKSAHVGKISKKDCLAARAYLILEPIRLLYALEFMATSIPLGHDPTI